MNKTHPNIEILQQLDLTNLAASANIIAENFLWHYFNTELPNVHGDYVGLKGLQEFFGKLAGLSSGTFQVEPISLTAIGEEFVLTHVKDHMNLKGQQMEVDAVVVWRIVGGKITEAWDIPAIHTPKLANGLPNG